MSNSSKHLKNENFLTFSKVLFLFSNPFLISPAKTIFLRSK